MAVNLLYEVKDPEAIRERLSAIEGVEYSCGCLRRLAHPVCGPASALSRAWPEARSYPRH